MVTCVTCGDELHPERARKYDYCTKPECRARNAKGLDLVAVGVNEAADQFLVLDERTRREMASGRVKKQPDVRSMRSTMAPRASQAPARRAAPARKARRARPHGSEAPENLPVS